MLNVYLSYNYGYCFFTHHRVFHCFCFCCCLVKWNLNDESKHYQLNIMENISTALVFIIVVVNVFITAFGVQRPNTGA